MDELEPSVTEYFDGLTNEIVKILAQDFYVGLCPEDREEYAKRARENLKPLEDALNKRIKGLEKQVEFLRGRLTAPENDAPF